LASSPGSPAAPVAVAEAALAALIDALRARDLDGALALFEPDAALFGSEAAERAVGEAELRSLLGSILAGEVTVGWTWEPGALVAAGWDDVVWFAGPAVAVLRAGDGSSERRLPYRLSGVLRRRAGAGASAAEGVSASRGASSWRFALFNGSEPAG
jgi:ketosteroid isomerase-like protein